MRKYSHPFFLQIAKYFSVFAGLVFPFFFLIDPIITHDFRNYGITLGIAFVVILLFLMTAYYYQDIWVDNDGLLVEFLWKRIRVEWTDIVEIKYMRSLKFLPEKNRPLIVLVKNLTPFHRIYGIFEGRSLKPGFIINFSIGKYQELKREIASHVTVRVEFEID